MDRRGPRRISGLAAALLVGSLVSCTWVAWRGHTPDRRVRVVVREKSGRQFVIRDGAREPSFDGIAVEGIAFSDDGRHLAYPARRGGRWCVVTDGVLGPFCEGVGFVRFGPGSAAPAYAILRKGKWVVVKDGSEGSALDSILAGSLAFSPDGSHLAYAGTLSGSSYVVMDGLAGPGYDGIAELSFSADSQHWVYIGRTGSLVRIVGDGNEGPTHDEIQEPRLSSSGGRLAYAARDGREWHVLSDGEKGPVFDAVHSLTFDPSGKSLAYVGIFDRRAAVVRDGKRGEAYDEIVTGSLVFSPDGRDLAFMAVQGGRMAAVLNGLPGPWNESVSNLAFDPCDGALIYIQGEGEMCRWVRNGVPGTDWTWIGQGVFSPGCRFGYIARGKDGMRVLIDGKEFPVDLAVDGSLVFSDDGKHWACLAGDSKIKKLFVIVDSLLIRRPFDWEEMAGEILRFPPGTMRLAEAADSLRRWVKAELELAIAEDQGKRTNGFQAAIASK